MVAGTDRADPAPDPPRTDAAEAGLRYVTDATPGIRRERRGRGFSYRRPDGSTVREPAVLARIRRLAIPPAWDDVWICPTPNGHLQATGRDARGRKQYRYHPDFRAHRDADKFDRIVRFGERLPRIRRRVARDLRARGLPRDKVLAAVVRLLELTLLRVGRTKYARTERFARALPRIRRRVARDLGRPGLPRERVLAAVVRLLERTLIRVGNDEYARDNRSFGAATLRDRHARIEGADIRLRFRGKAGRTHEVSIRDRRLAAIVKRCRDLPGQELFQYVDEGGEVRDVRSDEVNDYIRAAAGSDEFSAKDFRTWAGTVLAFRALAATGQAVGASADAAPTGAASARAVARSVRSAIEATAAQLGNTPAVARSAYVHPGVIDAYLEDGVRDAILAAADLNPAMPQPPRPAEERAVLRLLARQARREHARRGGPSSRRRPARESQGR